MLGKIIKYDMKAMNRFLIIIHAFLLIYAFFIRILITGRLTANNVHNLGNTYFLILGLTDPHPAGQKGNSPDCKSHCRNNLVHNRHNWTLCRYIHCCLGAICKRFSLRQ